MSVAADDKTAIRPPEAEASSERRCLASGVLKPREEMIRFVVGPEHKVVPDLAEKLPGRGLWVSADRSAVELVIKKGLFAKAAKQQAKANSGLVEQVVDLLRRRCLDLMGLAKGAGIAVLGENQTEAALRAGDIALFLQAPDATRVLDNRHNRAVCTVFTRDALGSAFGYDHIVYAGLRPHGLTRTLRREIGRLAGMTAAVVPVAPDDEKS